MVCFEQLLPFLVALSTGAHTPPTPKGPNVLLIVIDDQRPWFGAYNASWMHTPNVDAFAKTAAVFDRAYVQQAICGPTRTSFLTGRRPDSTRTYCMDAYWRVAAGNFTTLPQHFKEHGYQTRSIGKVFHPIGKMREAGHPDDMPYSWSEDPWHPSAHKDKNSKTCHRDGKLFADMVCPVDPAEEPKGTLPDIQSAEFAVESLGELAKRSHPWFLAVGFHKPHIPLKMPRSFFDLYPEGSVPAPSDPTIPEKMPPVAWEPWTDVKGRDDVVEFNLGLRDLMPANFTLLMRRAYAAATTYTDAQIGKVLDALEQSGQKENTIVVLLGDHGWQIGERGEFAKYAACETATHIPFIFRAPGVRPRHISSMAEAVSLFPTLADLARIPVPPVCPDGEAGDRTQLCVEAASLGPVLREETQEVAPELQAAFSQYPRPSDEPQEDSDCCGSDNAKVMGYSIRTISPNARYTEWVGFASQFEKNGTLTRAANWNDVHARELYLHDADPGEDENLAEDTAQANLVAKLSARLRDGWRSAMPTGYTLERTSLIV